MSLKIAPIESIRIWLDRTRHGRTDGRTDQGQGIPIVENIA